MSIENGPVEIVDLPINSMVIFNSYVTNYQRVQCEAPKIAKLVNKSPSNYSYKCHKP